MLAAVTTKSDASDVYVAASRARDVGDRPDRDDATIEKETVASVTPLPTHACEYFVGTPTRHQGAYTM